jgi:hypothetical protein
MRKKIRIPEIMPSNHDRKKAMPSIKKWFISQLVGEKGAKL